MKCLNCKKEILKSKKYCSTDCCNGLRKQEKIARLMKKNTYMLECDLVDFAKSLINEKTNRLEPNKMKPQYFNNNYILPRYYEIIEKTKMFRTLSFKERVEVIIHDKLKSEKTIDDYIVDIVKSNGGIDFNKVGLRWMEMNGYLNISKEILSIERDKFQEFLFLKTNSKKGCITCGNDTTFYGYSSGYSDFCSIRCVSNNDDIKTKKKKHKFDKKVDIVFNFKNVKPLFSKDEYIGSGQGVKYRFECNKCYTHFDSRIANGHVPLCPKCDYKHFNGNSNMENELISILEKDYVVEKSDRVILGGKELDIYIPDKNIAIEFNGIYWHSELNGKDKKYHLDKTNKCIDKGIQLIHVFENEWIGKQNIVRSIINSKLGSFEKRLFARKCGIKEISLKEKNQFLEENHLQGQDKSSIKIGLFYEDDLVSVMTFGKSRYNKKYQYEMHRFCNKIGYQIIGGASKLWTYFIRKYTPESVITYADRRYSDGTFYEKIGFNKIRESKPNYFYFKRNNVEILISRIKFQKHKLSSILKDYDENMTEWENMQNNDYDRIWDCGNYVFEWKTN